MEITVEQLKQFLKDLYGTVSEDLAGCQYSGYISDAIRESADVFTSIYRSDQRQFYYNNTELCMDALKELGYELKDFDDLDDALCKAGAVGEFMRLEREAYDELQNILNNYAINYILSNDIKITKKQLDDVLENIELNYDRFERFDEIDDLISETIENNTKKGEKNE